MPTLMDRLRRRPPETNIERKTETGLEVYHPNVVGLNDVLNSMGIVEVADGGYVLVEGGPAKKLYDPSDAQDPALPYIAEMGRTGATAYSWYLRQEYNPKLIGNLGILKYDEMRRSDATVRSSLRMVKTPLVAARWFVEPASEKKKDQTIAKFISDNLFCWMSTSWLQVLNEALLMLDYGYYMFEKVYDVRVVNGKERIVWKKFAPRHPLDVKQWHWDAGGGPLGVTLYTDFGGTGSVTLPMDSIALFTHEKEAGNIFGLSVLRSAYKHWYFKENLYKIDAIQKERHGIGIPIIKLPMGFNANDKSLAHEIGMNLRTNEKAHVVLPPMWDISFADLKSNPVDALQSANHHADMIYENILVEFLRTSNGRSTTDNPDAAYEMFLRSCHYLAEIVRDVMNQYCIPQLVNMNWANVDDYPELKVRRIGDVQDWRTLSFAIRNFVGAGVMTPDSELEDWIRDEMDMPRQDPATARTLATPQGQQAAKNKLTQQSNQVAEEQAQNQPDSVGAPQPGLGRQAPAANGRQQPTSQAGNDKRGN